MKDREIITDCMGVERFEQNRIVRYLLDEYDDMNKIWRLHNSGMFSHEEMLEFYQLIGYSVDGFYEVFPEEEDLDEDEDYLMDPDEWNLTEDEFLNDKPIHVLLRDDGYNKSEIRYMMENLAHYLANKAKYLTYGESGGIK